MKINWVVRFKNKAFLATFCTHIVSFVFELLALFEVVPGITQNKVMEIINQILYFGSLIGILIDPTVDGLSDSNRGLSYIEPAPNCYEDPTTDDGASLVG